MRRKKYYKFSKNERIDIRKLVKDGKVDLSEKVWFVLRGRNLNCCFDTLPKEK